MKTSKFTDEQIAFAIRQAETGTKAVKVCRKIGISDATFYIWKKKKYGGPGGSELRSLKQHAGTENCRRHGRLTQRSAIKEATLRSHRVHVIVVRCYVDFDYEEFISLFGLLKQTFPKIYLLLQYTLEELRLLLVL